MPDFDHPNAHLDEQIVSHAIVVVANAFRRCRMTPLAPKISARCNSFIFGELQGKRFVVYVRITLDDEQEEGVGPTPGALIDAAGELDAEPHLIRVHMRQAGQGIGFEYFGYDEFIDAVLGNEPQWNLTLLSGKSIRDYLDLVGGTRSVLNLESVIDDKFIELRLSINGKQPYAGTIHPGELLRSTIRSDEYDIFTCSCGHAGCAGISRGVVVVNDGPFTLWKAYYARGRKIFVFNRVQYQQEIVSKIKEAADLVRRGLGRGLIPYERRFDILERRIFEAEDAMPHGGYLP
jgi:hypothetical protein